MNRRQFTKTAALGAMAGCAASGISADPAEAAEEIIDIHQHINFHGRRNDELLAHQKRMGVTRTVLLPSGSALVQGSTDGGRSNGLAARVFGTAAAARLTAEHPEAFVYFCNEVPDSEGATKEIEKWLETGACGIGESKFHIECDAPSMIRIYEVASAYEVPVLLHFQHEAYNLGFDRFHKVLERFPKVSFIGHAQTWWGNIDAKHEQATMYPTGKVTPGGLTDRYLRDYPNMYGDLSAGSGKNALNRDEEHAAAFLERHQDKLMLGTDCADATGEGEKCSGSQQISNVRRLLPDPAAQAKIFSQNAKKIIRI